MKLKNKTVSAFTLLESLLTLGISCFIIMMLSGSLNGIFQNVEEKIFFLSFENLYCDTQKLANARQQSLTLTVSQEEVSTDFSAVKLPPSVKVDKTYQVNFDKAGGNSSLAKLTFQTSDKEFNYQLYLGSGKYKKTETQSLHTP